MQNLLQTYKIWPGVAAGMLVLSAALLAAGCGRPADQSAQDAAPEGR